MDGGFAELNLTQRLEAALLRMESGLIVLSAAKRAMLDGVDCSCCSPQSLAQTLVTLSRYEAVGERSVAMLSAAQAVHPRFERGYFTTDAMQNKGVRPTLIESYQLAGRLNEVIDATFHFSQRIKEELVPEVDLSPVLRQSLRLTA